MISFGSRIEMLVDRYLIDTTENVSFRYNHPVRQQKIVGFDELWEDPGSLGLTIFEQDGKIRCYYRGYPNSMEDEDAASCLSVSENGLDFKPYPVNEFNYQGITENNIIRMGNVCHNFAPFYDDNPNCKPDERFKAIAGIPATGGIFVYASADGVHWKQLCDEPVITKGAFDSMNMAFWNPHTKLYHCYSRWANHTDHGSFRSIQSCTSVDFLHWTDPVPNEYEIESGRYDIETGEQLYTNAVRPVPGAEHILISIPMRFYDGRAVVTAFDEKYPERYHDARGVSDAVLMTSRDGIHWHRPVKDAWLTGGLYKHEWTQRNFITLGGIIERGDYFYIYTEQNYMWDDDGIWAYSIPKYRFMSLYADGNGGSFTTNPLNFQTDDIHLNYSTSAYGYVKVTILDDTGAEIFVSDEIFGNELSHKLHVEGLSGKTGTMQIELKEAHLYALGSDMG